MQLRRLTSLLLASAFAAAPAHAQLRRTADNFNAWFTYYGELETAGRWGAIYDVSIRRSGPVREMYAAFARGGITYEITPAVKIAVGVSRSETWPYGEMPIAYRTPERRLWEQLQLTHSVGRVGLSHRYRVEQRWQGKKELPDDAVSDWVRVNRFRYQIRATVPLEGATLDDGEWYVSGANELLIAFGSNVQYNIFDQNRAAISFGYRVGKSLRLEAGYLEQLSLKSDGRRLEDNHTLTFSLFTSFSFKDKQA
ncbi:MAG: hypothetical protein MNPFHGCM_00886 [Gemmatimonadaceae bacterium]|nr:hypothetical protein [Gemmatimonadaceae bacterium]